MNVNIYIKGTATIDDKTKYPCIYNPKETWNGWDKPLFTWEQIEKIINDSGYTLSNKKVDMEGTIFHLVDAEDWMSDIWYDRLLFYEVHVQGQTLYCFDGWIWDCEPE